MTWRDGAPRWAGPLGRPFARLLRGARRLPGVTMAAALVIVTVVVVAVWGRDDRAPGPRAGTPVRVGVEHGASTVEYAERARARLRALDPGTAPVFALVSFDRYLAPGELVPALSGGSVVMALARVPEPGSQTQLVRLAVSRVPEDVVAGMDATAARKDIEAAEYGRLLRESADPDRRTVYQTGARIAAAEAAAYRRHCACVYAVVVRADLVTLTAIASREGVRVVDPAPEVRTPDRSVFLAPLPERHG